MWLSSILHPLFALINKQIEKKKKKGRKNNIITEKEMKKEFPGQAPTSRLHSEMDAAAAGGGGAAKRKRSFSEDDAYLILHR